MSKKSFISHLNESSRPTGIGRFESLEVIMANLGTLGPLLMGVLLVVVAVRQFYAATIGRRSVARRRSWPTTSGVITQSRIKYEAPYDDPDYSHAYMPDIQFRYTVQGRTYTGVDFEAHDPDREETVARLVDQYPLGRIVVVHYDPANPRYAFLDIGSGRSIARTVFIGVVELTLGLNLIIVSVARL